jgi:hypothetical protein
LVTKKVSIVLRSDLREYGSTGTDSTKGTRYVYAIRHPQYQHG